MQRKVTKRPFGFHVQTEAQRMLKLLQIADINAKAGFLDECKWLKRIEGTLKLPEISMASYSYSRSTLQEKLPK